jgi:hypothetical protein
VDDSTNLIVNALLKVGREEILKRYRPDSCIASTKIAIDVLSYFAIEAKPMVVRMLAYNALAWEAVSRQEQPDWDAGAWSLGLGFPGDPPDPTKWDGHLVAVSKEIVEGQVCILDLSMDQASRPHKQMTMEPSVFRIPEGVDEAWVQGEIPVMFESPEGCLVSYMAFPDDKSYSLSTNWADIKTRKETTGVIIRAINALLKQSQ